MITIFDLIQAMTEVFARIEDAEVTRIAPDEIKIEQEMQRITAVLTEEKSIVFSELFKDASTRAKILGIFLAILELVRLKKIRIYQAARFGEIYLSWRDAEDV